MSNHTEQIDYRTPAEIIADIENKKLIEFTDTSDLEIGVKVKVQLHKEDSYGEKYNGHTFIYKGNKPYYPTFQNIDNRELVCFLIPFYYEKVNDDNFSRIKNTVAKREEEIKKLKNLLEEIKDEN